MYSHMWYSLFMIKFNNINGMHSTMQAWHLYTYEHSYRWSVGHEYVIECWECLDEEFLNVSLDGGDLLFELRSFVLGDRASNNRTRHSTRTTKSCNTQCDTQCQRMNTSSAWYLNLSWVTQAKKNLQNTMWYIYNFSTWKSYKVQLEI